MARARLPCASVSSRDRKMFQGVSNRCSPHSMDRQTEARKDELLLLQVQSRGWHLGLLMAHSIQVTKPRWPGGDAQCWVIVSICGHPNSCPTLTQMRCCCPLSGPPRDHPRGQAAPPSAPSQDLARAHSAPTPGCQGAGKGWLLWLALPPLEPQPPRHCRLCTFRMSLAQPAALGAVITRCLTRAG